MRLVGASPTRAHLPRPPGEVGLGMDGVMGVETLPEAAGAHLDALEGRRPLCALPRRTAGEVAAAEGRRLQAGGGGGSRAVLQ